MRRINYYNVLSVLLLAVFIVVLSCSDDSSNEEDETEVNNNSDNSNNNNNTNPSTSLPLKLTMSFDHWKNTNGTCSSGWNFYPYKKCSKPSFGVKSYKESESVACGEKGSKVICNKCKHSSFGLETKTLIDKDTKIIVDRTNPNCTTAKNNYLNTLRKIYNSKEHIYDLTFIREFIEDIPLSNEEKKTLEAISAASFGKIPPTTPKRKVCLFHEKIELILGYKEQEDCSVCGSYNKTIYNTCRHPSHGVEEYNSKVSKECGINPDTILKATNKNLSKQQIQDQDGEVINCGTCDDISFDPDNMDETNQLSLIKRINCLLDNLDKTKENDMILRSLIQSELRLLLDFSDIINKNDPKLLDTIKEKI